MAFYLAKHLWLFVRLLILYVLFLKVRTASCHINASRNPCIDIEPSISRCPITDLSNNCASSFSFSFSVSSIFKSTGFLSSIPQIILFKTSSCSCTFSLPVIKYCVKCTALSCECSSLKTCFSPFLTIYFVLLNKKKENCIKLKVRHSRYKFFLALPVGQRPILYCLLTIAEICKSTCL